MKVLVGLQANFSVLSHLHVTEPSRELGKSGNMCGQGHSLANFADIAENPFGSPCRRNFRLLALRRFRGFSKFRDQVRSVQAGGFLPAFSFLPGGRRDAWPRGSPGSMLPVRRPQISRQGG